MALPYAKSQLVRYLTSKVIENVSKEIAQQTTARQPAAAAESEPTAIATPELRRLVDSINSAFAQTYEQIEALEARIDQADRRTRRLEQRWSWQMMVRIVLAVVIAFVLGLVAWQLLIAVGLAP